jgi:hypothetical protein
MLALAVSISASGCGAVYQTGTHVRAYRMAKTLQPGQSTVEVRNHWGEPDIRHDSNPTTQVWSYAKRANSNDVVATVVYTAAKEGDKGTFLDLEFVDSKLTTWREAEHTMPTKEKQIYGVGIGMGSSNPGSSSTHY